MVTVRVMVRVFGQGFGVLDGVGCNYVYRGVRIIKTYQYVITLYNCVRTPV